MEATPEQRQRLIETMFKRNHIRRECGMPPLNIDLAYAKGLNRILRKNLESQRQAQRLLLSSPKHRGADIILLNRPKCEKTVPP